MDALVINYCDEDKMSDDCIIPYYSEQWNSRGDIVGTTSLADVDNFYVHGKYYTYATSSLRNLPYKEIIT